MEFLPNDSREQLKTTSLPWESTPIGWSDIGLKRWQAVLALRLPVLSRADFRIDRGQNTWRGQWVVFGNTPGAILQLRVRASEAAPWIWVPTAAAGGLPWEPKDSLPAFLDTLASRFSRLTGAELTKATKSSDLAGVMSGPAWALLTSRSKAASLWRDDDASY